MKINESNIYENLRHYRSVNNKKQSEVAEVLGVDESTYGKIERGEIEITWSRIVKLAQFYGISAAQLTGDSPGHILSNISNSPIAMQFATQHMANEQQTQILIKLTDSLLQLQTQLFPIMQKVLEKL